MFDVVNHQHVPAGEESRVRASGIEAPRGSFNLITPPIPVRTQNSYSTLINGATIKRPSTTRSQSSVRFSDINLSYTSELSAAPQHEKEKRPDHKFDMKPSVNEKRVRGQSARPKRAIGQRVVSKHGKHPQKRTTKQQERDPFMKADHFAMKTLHYFDPNEKDGGRKPSDVPSPGKRLRFDAENLRVTYHPLIKDYGFMTVREGKTPFPHVGKPVDANELRERLRLTLKSYNRRWLMDSLSSGSGTMFTSEKSNGEPESFQAKRKKFYMCEFTLAKQRLSSEVMHRPELSIISTWRRSQSFLSTVQSKLELCDYIPLIGRLGDDDFDSQESSESFLKISQSNKLYNERL